MAFHISNFGMFAKGLQPFTDRNGFVPEADDKLEDLAFSGDFDMPDDGSGDTYDDDWADFKEAAVAATEQASAALKKWRKGVY